MMVKTIELIFIPHINQRPYMLDFYTIWVCGKHIKASAGLDFGAYFTHYELSTNDPQQNSVYDIHSLNVYGSPKLVLSAALNDFISLNIQGKYNVFAPTGNNNGFTPSYDSEFGSVYTSWSYGIGISYKF